VKTIRAKAVGMTETQIVSKGKIFVFDLVAFLLKGATA
jgi:hypothetical protein